MDNIRIGGMAFAPDSETIEKTGKVQVAPTDSDSSTCPLSPTPSPQTKHHHSHKEKENGAQAGRLGKDNSTMPGHSTIPCNLGTSMNPAHMAGWALII
jgi:hypothetical protein